MKIVLFGATGNIGQRVAKEALSRGLPAPSLAGAGRALIEGLKQAGVKRLIFVGGAGTLEVAPGARLMDAPGFPGAYRPEAQEGANALDVFRTEGEGVDWTFLSPAAEITPGRRSGGYRTTGEQFLADAEGRSRISMEDYAVALVDELERPRHSGRRFGVAY